MAGNTLDEQKIPLIINSYDGGVNNKLHPTLIPNNCFVDGQDIDHSTPGVLKTRNGYTDATGNYGNTQNRGMFEFAPDNSTKYLLGATSENPQKLIGWSGTGAWDAGGSFGDITGFTSNSGANEVNFAQVNNKVYLVNGADKAVEWSPGGGFSQQDGTVNGKFPSGTKTLVYWMGRLWTGGKAANPGYLYFSDALQPTVWDQTNMIFKVAFGTGQSIVALQPLRSGVMIIFMTHSIWQLSMVGDVFGLGAFGFPPQDQFQLQEIDPQIGCGAERSVQVIGSDVYFMDQGGNIRSLQRTALDAAQGTKSLPLSDSIQGFVDGFNHLASALSKTSSAIFGRKYYVSVCYGSSTVVNKTFVFDIPQQTWTGPWSFGMTRWGVTDVDGTLNLYGMKPEAVFRTYRMESGSSDNGTAISYQLTTKRFDFGLPYTKKMGYLFEAVFISTDVNTLTISVSKDGGGYSTLGTVESLAGNVETLPQTFPFFLGGGGGLVRKIIHIESLEAWFDIQFKFANANLDSDTQLLNFAILAYAQDLAGDDWSDS